MDPQVVDQVTYTFPASVDKKLLPEWDSIPKVFKEENSKNKYLTFAKQILGNQKLRAEYIKDGLDEQMVNRHLSCIARDLDIELSKKTTYIAYLLSLWMHPEKTKE